MLILTREPGQGIHIGTEVRVEIVKIADGEAVLNITAPRDMGIWRSELVEKDSTLLTKTKQKRTRHDSQTRANR
jgi:carbon storage regulator CsrA